MTNFLTPYPNHPQKWTIDLLFKNNRIRKHVTNFKTPPPSFRVDVINIMSHIKYVKESNFKKFVTPKMVEMGQNKDFLNLLKNLVIKFFWICNKNLYYLQCSCSNPIFEKNLVPVTLAKMYPADQVAWFLNQLYLQNKNVDAIHESWRLSHSSHATLKLAVF